MLKTLARKHRSSVSKTAARYKAKTATPHGKRVCFEASIDRGSRNPLVARFGGIPLRRSKTAVITDHQPHRPLYPRKKLIQQLLKGICELCKQTDDIEVHHIRRLADLAAIGTPPHWAKAMANKRRKTLMVCRDCHDQIHAHRATFTQ